MLFILSIQYISERKIIPFYFLNLTGWLFHFSSVFYLPLYFFLHKKISRKTITIISVLGVVIFIFQIEYIKQSVLFIAENVDGRLTDAINAYFTIDEYSSAYGITAGFIERIATCALIIIYYNKLTSRKEDIVFVNSFFLFFIIFFFFSEIRIIPVRVGGLFAFSYWVLYPRILETISLKNNRLAFLTFILLYALIKITSMTDNILYKYDNVIFGIQNFKDRLEIFDQVKPVLFK
jgi:hypothetical protein